MSDSTATTASTQHPQTNHNFPQQINVTFSLQVNVEDQSERNQWLDPVTGAVTIDAVADLGDILSENDCYPVSINNLTPAQIQKLLADMATT